MLGRAQKRTPLGVCRGNARTDSRSLEPQLRIRHGLKQERASRVRGTPVLVFGGGENSLRGLS